MGEVTLLSPEKYFQEAKQMLTKNDFVEFLMKIGNALLLSKNDKEMFARTTYLHVQGLIAFNQYSKALESIEVALKHNSGEEAFDLKKCKGLAQGYLGKANEALEIFRELLTESDDINLLVGVYINIAWVNLTLIKNKELHNMEEVKHYLDLAEEHFESLSNRHKWKVRNAYSVYYFYTEEYEKAIEILESSMKYCEEEEIPDVYNNLAELYLKISEKDGSDNSEVIKKYLDQAEVLGTKYKNNLALGYIFYTKAMIELREEQRFKALDTLYLSFEFFKDAEATVKACDTLVKIHELMDEYKHQSLQSFQNNLKYRLKGTSY